MVKSMVDNDPMKDLISMVREEMKQSREHDFQLYHLMFNDSMNNHQAARQIPDTPHFYQQNSYYQGLWFPCNNPNSKNQPTISSSETVNVQQNLFPESYPYGSLYDSNASTSQHQKQYHTL